jgi:hypothetical protein
MQPETCRITASILTIEQRTFVISIYCSISVLSCICYLDLETRWGFGSDRRIYYPG